VPLAERRLAPAKARPREQLLPGALSFPALLYPAPLYPAPLYPVYPALSCQCPGHARTLAVASCRPSTARASTRDGPYQVRCLPLTSAVGRPVNASGPSEAVKR
jgi:hypothetical protein